MTPLSRRSLLRRASQVAALGAVVSVLDACGGSSSAPTATAGAAATPLVFPTQVPQTFPTAAAASQAAPVARTLRARPAPPRRRADTALLLPADLSRMSASRRRWLGTEQPRPAGRDRPIPVRHERYLRGIGAVGREDAVAARVLATSWQPSADGKQWSIQVAAGRQVP